MLIVSIHDVAPKNLEVVKRQRADLSRLGVDRVGLLAVPNMHGIDPLWESPKTCRWLRERAALGDEVVLHGYNHAQFGRPSDVRGRIRAALLTDGEGEFLTLDRAGRRDRLARGRATLEDIVDRPIRGFVAPAWLEPTGFSAELAETGFGWHETATTLELFGALGAPSKVFRAPVIGFATRSLGRTLSSVAWAEALMRMFQHMRNIVVRVAVHPADIQSRLVRAQLERCVRHLVPRGVGSVSDIPISAGGRS